MGVQLALGTWHPANPAPSTQLNENQIMNPITHLQKVRKLIENPENWTQGASARDRYGDFVDFDDPTACKFCLVGASAKVDYHVTLSYLIFVPSTHANIAEFNDDPNRTHAEVLQLIDDAIKYHQEQS